MSNLVLPRRRFLAGMAALFAAPAIVRVASLMPVRAISGEWGSDMVYSVAPIDIGPGWPRTALSMIAHRRDLADVKEPYLSAIIKHRHEGHLVDSFASAILRESMA